MKTLFIIVLLVVFYYGTVLARRQSRVMKQRRRELMDRYRQRVEDDIEETESRLRKSD